MKTHDCIPSRSRLAVASSLALITCFAASQVQAQEFWVGGGGSSSWGTGANWLDGTATFGFNVDLEFSHTSWTGADTRIGGDRIVRSITYNDNWGSANGSVRFNNNGSSGTTDTARNLTFRSPSISLSPRLLLTSGMSGSLIWGTNGNAVFGNLVLNSEADDNLILQVDGSGSLRINAPITESASNQGIIRNGAGSGVITFGPYASTYNGDTRVDAGKLRAVAGGSCANSEVVLNGAGATFGILINNNANSWTCSDLTVAAAGTLEFDFGAVAPSTSVSPLIVTTNGTSTGTATFTATPTISVLVDSGLAAGVYPLMTWDSVSGAVPTAVTLNNLLAETYVELSVTDNTLNLVVIATAPNIVKADNTDDLDLGSSWVGGVAPTSTDAAVWDGTVTSANTTVLGADLTWAGLSIKDPTGPVTINAGNTLTLGDNPVDIDMSAATADLTLNCDLTLGDANVWDIPDFRTLTIGGAVSGDFPLDIQGSGTVRLGAGDLLPDGTGNGNITLDATLDLNGNSETINGLNGSGIVDTTAASAAVTLTVGANNQSGTFDGVLQNTGTSATLNLVKTGTGTLVLNGENTLGGSVSIMEGTLGLNGANAMDNVTGITMNDGTVLRAQLTGTTIVSPITLGAAATTSTIAAPLLPPDNTAATTQKVLNLQGAISGDGDLVLAGVNGYNQYGRIDLEAQNDYTGATLITTLSAYDGAPPNNSNIFVNLGVPDALPTTTVLTLDGGDGGGGGRFCELNLNGNNQTLAGLTNVSDRNLRFQQVVNRNGNAATLTINNSEPYTYAARIGAPTQTGLATDGNNMALTKSGAGVFTLSGNNTYTGTTTITGGTLALGSSTALPEASAVSIGAATLDVGAAVSAATTGTLECTGAATINLGGGTSAITFGDSSGVTWSGSLTITGSFVSGSSLRFGTDANGLTSGQLAAISGPGLSGIGIDSNGFITATVDSGGYAAWAATNAGGQGPELDFDGDGVANGIEFFLNAAPGFTALPALDGSNSITWTNGGNIPASAYGTQFVIQTSGNLAGWTDVPVGELTANTDGPAGSLSYTLTGGSPRFVRLKVMPE